MFLRVTEDTGVPYLNSCPHAPLHPRKAGNILVTPPVLRMSIGSGNRLQLDNTSAHLPPIQ